MREFNFGDIVVADLGPVKVGGKVEYEKGDKIGVSLNDWKMDEQEFFEWTDMRLTDEDNSARARWWVHRPMKDAKGKNDFRVGSIARDGEIREVSVVNSRAVEFKRPMLKKWEDNRA